MTEDFNFQIVTAPELPDKVSQALMRQLPGLDLEAVEDAAATFVLAPSLELGNPSAEKAGLEAVARASSALHSALKELGPFALQTLAEEFAEGRPARLKTLRGMLASLSEKASSLGENAIVPKGRPQSHKTYLVQELARILERAGYPINSKENGHLGYLVAEVLYWLTGEIGDVRTLLRNALRN